jgi:hypothetical protein
MIKVADVNRRVARGAASLERDVEESRRRLFDPLVRRVEHAVEAPREIEPIEMRAQRAVGVGDHDEPQAPCAHRLESRDHVVRHVLPQVARGVIRVQVCERRRRAIRPLDARMREDEVEEQPPAARVRGGADRPRVVQLPPRVRVRRNQRVSRHRDPSLRERFRHAPPVGINQDAAGIQKHSFERHSLTS